MRCRKALNQLTAQRKTEPDQSESDALQLREHLKQCQTSLNTLLQPEPARVYRVIPTERIMQAVERERRISQHLEHIQSRQQARLARVSKAGLRIAGAAIFVTGTLVIGLVALFLFLPEVFISLLSNLSGFIDALYGLAGYLQAGLLLISGQTWLLSGGALVVVVMMGMWLRLMRYPREA